MNLAGFDENPFYNVSCSDANTCFVIGNSATTGLDHWRTSNAGATWQQITVFPLGGSWYHIDFVSPTVGFMGSNGATVRSTESGVTWQVLSGYPSCPVMYGMDFRDTQVGLCGGDRVSTTDGGPGIFKTTDAGVTWVRKLSQSANDVLWLNDTTAIATVGVSIYRSNSLVFNFTSNVVSGNASLTSGTGTAGTPVFSGTTMTVPLSGVADVQKLTITLTGVTDVSSQVLPSTPVSMNVLIGDANGGKTVDTSDVTLTRGQVGMAVTGTNFREDVRVDGAITSADVKQVRTAVGHSLP